MSKFAGYFKVLGPKNHVTTMTDNQNIGDQGTYAQYGWFQRLIQGSASRLTRYREYELMDNDVEIARSLDTIAEEMVGSNPNSDLPIELVILSDKQSNISPSSVTTLKSALTYWSNIHDFRIRLFKICRNMIKFGDCFFIRKSDTSKWEYVNAKNVVAAIVDVHDMTRILGWQIKSHTKTPNSPQSQPTGHYGHYSNETVDTYSVDNVVWFTLNDDISDIAPFGDSVLRAVYRAQKQKELLEDAIIIYRLQRAPERRAFYIDVGKMHPSRVKGHLEQIKNDIRQRKVPNNLGGMDQVDSVYNPQAMGEDFFFASRDGGKGTRVENLSGGANLGELADLEYFQWKVFRGLRIPLSYMREGGDGSTFNDGKTGIAYIQELRFAMYVKRLQNYVSKILDQEFKRYLRAAGINVDPHIFTVKLPEPENFGIYRQQQLDSDLLNTYSNADGIQHLSKRFAMKKYLQLTDEELATNEKMKREEMGLNPEGGKEDYIQLYGQPSETGSLGGGLGSDLGMNAGTLGGPNFDMVEIPGANSTPETENTEKPQPPPTT